MKASSIFAIRHDHLAIYKCLRFRARLSSCVRNRICLLAYYYRVIAERRHFSGRSRIVDIWRQQRRSKSISRHRRRCKDEYGVMSMLAYRRDRPADDARPSNKTTPHAAELARHVDSRRRLPLMKVRRAEKPARDDCRLLSMCRQGAAKITRRRRRIDA